MKRSAKVVNGTRIRKYTVTSHRVLCDDGVTRDNVSLNSELAKPIGIVSATQTSMNKQPRTYSRASECISYYLEDDGNKVRATIFRESPTNKRARAVKNIPTNRKLTAADLRPIFAD